MEIVKLKLKNCVDESMLSMLNVDYSTYIFVLLYGTYKILLSLLCLSQSVVPSVISTNICT